VQFEKCKKKVSPTKVVSKKGWNNAPTVLQAHRATFAVLVGLLKTQPQIKYKTPRGDVHLDMEIDPFQMK
jgi:hypothetical protein